MVAVVARSRKVALGFLNIFAMRIAFVPDCLNVRLPRATPLRNILAPLRNIRLRCLAPLRLRRNRPSSPSLSVVIPAPFLALFRVVSTSALIDLGGSHVDPGIGSSGHPSFPIDFKPKRVWQLVSIYDTAGVDSMAATKTK